MPRGPKGEKRPGDVIGAAIMVGRIATGEIEEPHGLEGFLGSYYGARGCRGLGGGTMRRGPRTGK